MNKEDLWCEYSDMPSPLAYVKCADYDSMGNHGRFPKSKSRVKKQKKNGMRRIIQKFTLSSQRRNENQFGIFKMRLYEEHKSDIQR